MTEKKHITLEKAKQVVEDYIMFLGLYLGRPLWIDFSKHSSEIIIEFAESLPQGFINYSNTLDEVVERMEKNIKKMQNQVTDDDEF